MEHAIVTSHHSIQLSVLDGTFTRNGRRETLSGREHAFLALLAISSRPRSVCELGEIMWPDREDEAARNCAKVYAHRVRMRLGRPDAVLRAFTGYILGGCVEVDTRCIEATLARARVARAIDPSLRSAIDDALTRLGAATAAAARGFHEIERYLARLATELAMLAFDDARRGGDHRRALSAALRLVDFDPCDEMGHELAILAHLGRGDDVSAARTYRDHVRVLRHELDTEPSERLRSLLARSGQYAGQAPPNSVTRYARAWQRTTGGE